MKVTFNKVITKMWKSHLKVWVAKRHFNGWLLAKPNIMNLCLDFCSSPNTKHSHPAIMPKLPLCILSNTELLFSYKTHHSILQAPFSFPPPLKTQKVRIFGVKILISNHCKSSGSTFLRTSIIKYQVLYYQNSSHFAGFCVWFVCFS